jgi:hypothetical protein
MRLHPSTRTLGLTASLLSVAILVPAAALAAGPRDGTCDPAGTGPNGPVAAAPGNGNGYGAQANANGNGNGPRVQANANGNGYGAQANVDRGRVNAGAQAAWKQARRGPGQGIQQPAMGVLTADQQLDLQAMAEEEKLAHDVYTKLDALFGGTVFERIAASEANHLAAIRTLLARYGLEDPTADKPVGTFTSEPFQALYDQFLAQGSVSLDAAYDVGVAIEQDDLGRLADAKAGLTAPDVLRVYTNLDAGSKRHLATFSAL